MLVNPSTAPPEREIGALFRLIAENVSQAFFLMSADCRQMFYVSPAFERIFQVTRAAVYQDALCWMERIHPDDLSLVDPSANEPLLSGLGEYEYRLITLDGAQRWVSAQTFAVTDDEGHVSRIVGILSDITERKGHHLALARSRDEAEALVSHRTKELLATNEELLASEARFRTLAETVPVAIFIQHEARVIYANPAALARTGLTHAQVAALDLTAMLSAHGLRDLSRGAGVDVDFVRGDGDLRVFHMHAARVHFEQRECLLVTAVDETEHRRAERALREHQASVARIAHMSTLEGFASSLAHELNQPLSAVASYARALINHTSGAPIDAALLRQGLERIEAQALRAGEIMRRLRNFAVRGEIQRRPLDMNAVAVETLASLKEIADRQGVTLRAKGAEALPQVVGDPIHLGIALSNLVRNAIEAVSDRPMPARFVEVATTAVSGRVQVEVRDEGAGVSPGIGSTLFEPLVSTKHDGMGIGLAITRTIVEAHRGTISLVPSERGAVFRIELPAAGG